MTDDLITWLWTVLDEVETAAARDLASVERHDLAVEILVEVDAKRRILDAYERARDAGATAFQTQYEAGRAAGLEEAVELLALPYAGRPDYREEWRCSAAGWA